MSDPELPRKLIKLLMEQQALPDKELVIIVALDAEMQVRVGSYSPVPVTQMVLQATLLEAVDVLGKPGARKETEVIKLDETGKA